MRVIILGLILSVWVFGQDKGLAYVFTQTSPKQTLDVYNGTVLIVATQIDLPPLKLGNRTFEWLPHPTNSNQKIALVSIPYRIPFQTFDLNEKLSISVKDGRYKQEQITVAPSKAKPNRADLQRIAKEKEEANKIYNTYTKERYWDSPFIQPLTSAITSVFGNARVFNQEVKSYHSGTDFRAAIGTPIVASNDGVVVIAKDRFYAGHGVVIDHGEGVFSMYYHCSELKVSAGQRVKKGELIALSGNTGRVSGPHLHFAFFVNGTFVDPLEFINSINNLMPL